MGGRRLQFVIYVPKGMKVTDINTIEDHIRVGVLEGHESIEWLSLERAKKKYG
jgi:hypothetical protein